MPNTAISIRESMTCVTTIQKWEHHLDKVKRSLIMWGNGYN